MAERRLDSNPLGDEGISALAASSSLPVLQDLTAWSCGAGDAGILAIANSELGKRCTKILLDTHDLEEATRHALIHAKGHSVPTRQRWQRELSRR